MSCNKRGLGREARQITPAGDRQDNNGTLPSPL